MINETITIGFYRNYSYPDLLRQSMDNLGGWNNLQFIDLDKNSEKKVDFLLVLNHANTNIHLKIRKGGSIILIQEPPYEVNNYLKRIIKHFDLSVCSFEEIDSKKNLDIPAALPWHINKSYTELSTMVELENKLDKASWITSSNNFFSGHKTRLSFIDYLKSEKFDFDLYGRGFNPIDDKFEGINPYKYSIAAENYISNDYFTEKIIDIYLSGSMPLYYGCLNIEKYFPENSFVKLEMTNHKKAKEQIQNAIKDNLYEKNYESIKEARDLILNKYQLFPMIENLLKNHVHISNRYIKFDLQKDGLSKIERLKRYFRKK